MPQNQNARIVVCGMISRYNETAPSPGPRNIWQLVAKTATMHGFLNRFYMAHFEQGLKDLGQWVREGRLHAREHVETGIENFHPAFMRLFDGSNEGLTCTDRPVFSVQYHPEAAPGPHDSHYLFDDFVKLMEGNR